MNSLRLWPAAALLLAALPALAQDQGYSSRDAAKAQKLASQDGDFRKLSEDEKQKVIEAIALQIHGRRRKAREAMIVTRKGQSVEELEKKAKTMHGYELVSSQQDKEAVDVPAETNIETHEVHTPDLGRLFADNDWEIVEGSPDAENLRKQVDAVLTMIKKTDGRVVSIHVESSASTLKNTGKAANMTHLELSQKRAEAAADYVTKRLAQNGVALQDDQITLDYTGGNGNGTTGPSSPFPCSDPKLCAEGSCLAPQDLEDAVKKGPLDAAAKKRLSEVYDPYKFVSVSFVVANQTATTKPGVSTPGEAHAVLVHVAYKEKPEFHWPRISLHINLPKSHRNWGSTKCPRF